MIRLIKYLGESLMMITLVPLAILIIGGGFLGLTLGLPVYLLHLMLEVYDINGWLTGLVMIVYYTIVFSIFRFVEDNR